MRFRFRYRAAIFGAIVALLIAGRYYPELAAWPTAASPFLGVATLIGTGTLVVPALVLAAVCLFRRRILCHSACPLGFCFDVIGKTRKAATGSNRLPKFLHGFPRLGVFLAVFTWLGCAWGAVGFIWLDPLVLFGSPFHVHQIPSTKHPLTIWSPLVSILVILLGTAWLLPTFWCRCFCPLGGTQDLLYWPKSKFHAAKNNDESSPVRRNRRRRFLANGIAFVFFVALFRYLQRYTLGRTWFFRVRRPPNFCCDLPTTYALCARCGACAKACPTGLIVMRTDTRTLLDVATPYTAFNDSTWCKADCNACALACPTGAIRKFSIEGKKHIKLGMAVLGDFEKCRLYEDVECSICRRDCPYDAVSYEWSDEEYRRVPVIDTNICTGCGRCVVSCPGLGKNEPKPLKITDPPVQ